MGIQQTSLEAWEEVRYNLGEKQKLVYEALKFLRTANDKMIAKRLNWPINCITNRRGELVRRRLVGVSFVGPDLFSGRNTIYWKVVK